MPSFEHGYRSPDNQLVVEKQKGAEKVRAMDLMREYRAQASKEARVALLEAPPEVRSELEKRYMSQERFLQEIDEDGFFRQYVITPDAWNNHVVPLLKEVLPVSTSEPAVSEESAALELVRLLDEGMADGRLPIEKASQDEMGNDLPLKNKDGVLVDAHGRFVARIDRLPPRWVGYTKGSKDLPGFDQSLVKRANEMNFHHDYLFYRKDTEKWPLAATLDVGLIGVCDAPNIAVAHRRLVRIEPVTPQEEAEGLVKIKVINGDSAVVARREIKEFRVAPEE